ncbi:hypothetical protein Q1Z72_01620 [Pseudomonas qingdaonensis]|uniref:hypothetical protein n=1 Tax=Pseudomonas TaxID=286 RepID=UPI0021C22776|nr:MULTISPECIES: hypothetical protein [Pseudomonas]UXH55902.1 hypothetical protein N5876_32665 [Pseudomonas aeruginosa]UXH68946.1 hypothetical protein N5879_32790 [Pseudomonas aeruginosa]WKL67394.1 hypothetical protein Q1Z72_01620 [Pseudomonas qingdaonensis]
MSKNLIDALKHASEGNPPHADLLLQAAEALSLQATERELLVRQISRQRQLIIDDRSLITEMEPVLADAREFLRQHGQNVLVNRASECLRHYDASLGIKPEKAGERA